MDGHAVYPEARLALDVIFRSRRRFESVSASTSPQTPVDNESIMQPSTASGYPRVPVVHQDCTVQVFCFRMVDGRLESINPPQDMMIIVIIPPQCSHDQNERQKIKQKNEKGQTLTLPPCRVLLLRDGLARVPPSVGTSLQARMPTWVFHQNQ